jgi:hypothetical protein
MDRRRAAGKINPELPHLKALRESAPRTKSGRIVWAWPEIQASLASGRKMHEIWEALQLDGIEMSYGQFRTYVWRIRKRGVPTAVSAGESAMVTSPGSGELIVPPQSVVPASQSTISVRDPLANIRESEKKRDSFDYRPELADPKKLI